MAVKPILGRKMPIRWSGDVPESGYWKFDETSGTLIDSSGRGNHGTAFGGPTYGVLGKLGTALDFDGVDDYVNAGDKPQWNFGSSGFSVSLWLKPNGNSNEKDGVITFVSDPTVGNNPRVSIGYGDTWANAGLAGNKIGLGLNYSGGWGVDLIGATNLANAWHQVVLTRSGSAWRVYLDGITGSPEISTTYAFDPPSATLLMGAHVTTGRLFKGTLDDLRVYNRALSLGDVTALYSI